MAKNTNGNSGVKEIARLANVSIGTVDRVIHNRPGVSEKTREKINKIINDLNYQPNILASRLASRKVYKIAVFIPHTSQETDFWEAPLRGIKRAEKEIRNYGLQLSYHFFDLADRSVFDKEAKKLLKSKPDGVLMAPSFATEARGFLHACADKKIPVVLIDSNLPDEERLCYIGPDMFYSGYQAAHLIHFGKKDISKILFIEVSTEATDQETEKGFRAYFNHKKQKLSIIKLNVSNSSAKTVKSTLAKLFKAENDIEAVFVSNSRVSTVASFLAGVESKHILLIGYDILPDNIKFLESGTIDFLLCHKPEEQGYRGIMMFLQKLVLNTSIEPVYHMPIDIITPENWRFYHN